MSNLPLLEPLIFSAPQLSVFFFFNLSLSLFSFVSALYLFCINKYILVRPAYFCAIGWLLLYQIPTAIFSSEFFASLMHAWKWSIMIHAVGLSLLAWCALVSSQVGARSQNVRFDFPDLGFVARWFPVGLLLVAVAVYFHAVPYDCTGLYALWADPWMTLLAREFSVKLIGSSPATYALGAAANIVSPLTVVFSIFHAKKFLLQGKYFHFFVWLVIGASAVVLVLTSGAKGLLMPTLIMAAITSLLWGNGWLSRGGMWVVAVGLVVVTMVFFELARERDGIAGAKYDFAQCSVETNTCTQGLALIQSLGYREGSLGLSNRLIGQVRDRLSCMCVDRLSSDQCLLVSVPTYGSKRVSQKDRATTLFEAILNRAFAVPFQVGAWHLMYAETESPNGWESLPFSRRLLGSSLNMPELVYQKYGTVYSEGDRTSTSTAPTSFLLSYPAYLGSIGFFIALGCLIIWDFVYSFFSFRMKKDLWPIAAGMAAITAMNFMSSDFVTTLVSHGGVPGLCIVVAFIFLGRNEGNNKLPWER